MSDDPSLTSDVSDFDFDRSASESWRRFADRLAEVLSVMDPGATLAIGSLAEAGQNAPHVLFTCGEAGALTAAATTAGLGPEAGAALEASGWTPAPDEPGTWQRHGTQEEAEALATAASDALRDVHGVQHPALLAPDQLADILTPAPAEVPGAGQAIVVASPERIEPILAATPDELDAALVRELTSLLGFEPLRDDAGDLALRVGSTMVLVRAALDAQEVLVFAPLVHDVEGRSRAMEVLSDLNTDARWVRFQLIRDRVYVSMSVPAAPLIPAHLHRAFHIVSLISDSIDDALAQKLRGRTTFEGEDADGEG
ncbi:MAG: hypothetical protein Q4F65_05790 [Propionibacteriaceae bacterium]|nr:hypothetical protein [Propionibacteriaceae bacterium]